MLKKHQVLIILLFFAQSIITQAATRSEAWVACQAQIASLVPSGYTNAQYYGGAGLICYTPASSTDLTGQYQPFTQWNGVLYGVPNTWTSLCAAGSVYTDSTHLCIAPCTGNQVTNPLTGQCQTPVVCSQFETINLSTNTCAPITCSTGQFTVGDGTSSTCQSVQNCTGTEICGVADYFCQTENGSFRTIAACPPPTCSTGSHLSPEKTCVLDAQLACPVGQHANAQNTQCVADDVTACPAGTYYGTINGQKQCIQGKNPNPNNNNNPSPIPQSINTGSEVSQTTTTTTTNNSTGSTAVSNTTTTTTTKLDTTGLAQESTNREIANSLKADAQSPDPAPGLFYPPSTDTLQSVASSGINTLKSKPIVSFGQGIFTVTIPSGTCPTMTSPALPFTNGQTVTFDQLCGPLADQVFSWVRPVLLAMSVFVSFKIATST